MRSVVPDTRWVSARALRAGCHADSTNLPHVRGAGDTELGALREQLAAELAALESQLRRLDGLLERREAS